ncbi:MAG: M23 family metallopeptidase, partial [Bacteroidota bacterium]
MAPELTDFHIHYIKARLEEEGLEYGPLKEELLDHLCCAIEDQMKDGAHFHIACEKAFAAFGKDGIQKIQLQTIRSLNQKSQLMKIIAAAVLFLLGAYSSHHLLTDSEPTLEAHCEDICCEVPTYADWGEEPPSIRPVKGHWKVSSGFGMRMHPIQKKKIHHRGIDLKAPLGTPVVATADGEVFKVHRHKKGHGLHIYIQHDDTYTTMYAHLSEIKVEEGQKVDKGTVIGLVG